MKKVEETVLEAKRVSKLTVEELPKPINNKFIIENPVVESGVIELSDEARENYIKDQLVKFEKVKVLKKDDSITAFEEGDYVKIIPGRQGEVLNDLNYIMYYNTDVSAIWTNKS
ncbi:MAG: hypothetical protein V3S79_02845 [Candidatus Thermoplasmatota archaeon]